MNRDQLSAFLENSYARFNHPEFLDPDPLLVPRDYGKVSDREIAGLISSCLALGRAASILKASRSLLALMTASPRAWVEAGSEKVFRRAFGDWKYRFFSGDDIAALLCGVKKITGKNGSLGEAFSSFMKPDDETVLPALSLLVAEIIRASPPFAKNLLPSPEGGSACKRLLLYLRWMVRKDSVDPGGWDTGMASRLVQPMDTHMTWVSHRFGFIDGAKAPDLKSALAVTARFREVSPLDPVKYDFCLTRPGIRPDLDRDEWFGPC